MGVFDHAARFAAQADPEAVPLRLLAAEGRRFAFREWLDTRTLPLPGGQDRTADLVAAMDDPVSPYVPWLVVLEFQAQPDEAKLDVTLQEVAALRVSARHGADRLGRYYAVAGLVYLVGKCPATLLDMTLPSGAGTRHKVLEWNVADDDAAATVERVAAGELSWAMLHWVPLMAGGGDDSVIKRWRDVASLIVGDDKRRGNLLINVFVFAELARRVPEWRRVMEGIEWTESEVVNDWLRRGNERGMLRATRQRLIELIDVRFPEQLPPDYRKMIEQQESPSLLDVWFRVAAGPNSTIDEVLATLRQ